MASKDKNDAGIWLDKDTGKIARKPPRRGRLLVPAGEEVDDAAQAVIDQHTAIDDNADDKPAKTAKTKGAKSD